MPDPLVCLLPIVGDRVFANSAKLLPYETVRGAAYSVTEPESVAEGPMADSDPFKTQHDLDIDVVAELSAAGLTDAEEIGRGGFGVVYRCTQSVLDRVVAVKILTCDLEESRERFFREQRAMGRLTGHPNIVGILEVGETATGRPYLIMPYCSAGSLDKQLRRDGPLPLDGVLRLGVRMAGALETAHRADVLHRDVKPGNILITDYGDLALTDFGIAHLAGGFQTATGTVTGSPAFTAPEVLGGDPTTGASDVYGLGATLFCALTGHAAFERRSGEQVVAQFLRITTQPVPDLREHGIPEDVSAVIETAMCRDPLGRPTATELGEQLQRVQVAHGLDIDQMALHLDRSSTQAAPVPVSPLHSASSSGLAGSAKLSRGAGLRPGGGNLPLELTSFVDRRAQVSEVKNRLSASNLVTLTGIGGVGKSRLALRVAHKMQRDFPGGVWLVELAELRDPSLLVDVVARTFGLLRRDGKPMLEVLKEHLAGRQVLVLLDNCEHMIEAVAKLTESLLEACPQTRILATSREPMCIGAESVLPVPPLKFPDPSRGASVRGAASYEAVTLFVERAVTVVPDFRLDETNRAGVVGICARLDGLPLAIELAAARLRTMSPEQILARLTDRFALLTRGSRSAPTRQQTLGWCIDWSYELCTPAEQTLWRRLSAFAGSFELDAAQNVCGTDSTELELLDALSALIDKSILIREQIGPTVRFRLLETVQEYGQQRIIEAGGQAELIRRHRDWCERLALDAEADWVSPRQLEWLTRITRELPNLRKALEFSISDRDAAGLRTVAALNSFWAATGRFSEGRRWCERALARASDASDADRARAQYMMSVFAAALDDMPAAAGHVAELRVLAEQTADPSIDALLAEAEGYTALSRGDLALACTRLNDAVETFRIHDETLLELKALISLGWVYVLQKNMPRAVVCLERCLRISADHGETAYRSVALRPMAVAVWRQGDARRAEQLLQEALRLARQVVDPIVAALGLEILAWILAEKRDGRRAAALLGAADSLFREIGSSIMFPQLLPYHEECWRNTHDMLGGRGFESAHREGAAMRFEAAIGFALEEAQPAESPRDREAASLTKRERQVAKLIAEGLTNKAIAARLVISQRTAQGHVEHILTKLGFTSRAQIAVWTSEHCGDTLA